MKWPFGQRAAKEEKEPILPDAAKQTNVCYPAGATKIESYCMFGFGRRSKTLPSLDGNLKWWVIESERFNLESKAAFRTFEAVVAQSEEAAIEHLRISDEKLDKSLMNAAIRAGKIEDEFEWEPISTHVRYLSVSSVTTEAEIAERDEVLLGMLKEHHFFLDEFKEDPHMAIGGGIYDEP